MLSETSRSERDEIFETPGQHRLCLSGGSGHCGVGICVSHRLLTECDDLVFHALNERLCFLSFRVGLKRFVLFACYFPTSRAINDELNHMCIQFCIFFWALPVEMDEFPWPAVIQCLHWRGSRV